MKKIRKISTLAIVIMATIAQVVSALEQPVNVQKTLRQEVELKDNWITWLEKDLANRKTVTIPHNWDDYYGYRQLTHGNLHGTAYYTTSFTVSEEKGKAYFLRFEGVGTYADVMLNDQHLGRYPVGRTTLTLDISQAIRHDQANRLTVKAEHPELITDMPWVCGGCSSEWGFSEGSQPFGIYRPVVLEVTDHVRVEPFGIHIWHDDDLKTIYIETELKNYGIKEETLVIVNKFCEQEGKQVFSLSQPVTLKPGENRTIRQSAAINNPQLWEPGNPYLYQLTTQVLRQGTAVDETITPFGIRSISWPVKRNDGNGCFLINGKPFFLNGVCEYEHLFGQSHAFSHEQVAARVKAIQAAGFNAVRDAHQPHHLDYQKAWDREGIIFWPQFSTHIWYDTPEFRNNFKRLLRQWIKERRNSPSVVLWGLQNESSLPKSFAMECMDIIHEMDPTALHMRAVTTCNGGEGTDWNVVQNWSGTYGGTLGNYALDLSRKDQLLNGEYGAWRTFGFHTEPEASSVGSPWSEERICWLMETKVRLAEQAKDSVCGHFQWIYNSHENPGRRQADEAYRKIDKVGPFNYKGLITPWEEPADVYYMYRANYVPASKDPMVYLVSHTWPYRFSTGSRQATIEAYSNCDSVILYNDLKNSERIGVQKRQSIGTHFIWKNSFIRYNVLRAVGYHDGQLVAEDILILDSLKQAPHFELLYEGAQPLLQKAEGYHYLYRINCGGDTYVDSFGERWMQDNHHYSTSWAKRFAGLNPYLASQRTTSDPIKGTRDWGLFQTFRFGRHELKYQLPLPDGTYRVELYFIEPWHGTGSSFTDCKGLRIFDVAINKTLVMDDFDIWAEVGHDRAYKKVVEAEVKGGKLELSFPEVKAGQALLCGLAVASRKPIQLPPYRTDASFSWEQAEQDTLANTPNELLPTDPIIRPTTIYQAEEARATGTYEYKELKGQQGIFFGKNTKNSIEWTIQTGLAQIYALRFKFINASGQSLNLRLQVIDSQNTVLKDDVLLFPATSGNWSMISTTTGTYINAGTYRIRLSAKQTDGLGIDALEVQ